MWSEALLAKFDPEEAARKGIKPYGRAEFDMLLGKFGAVTDIPAAVLTEELLAAYPNVKVILHERDEERWYASFKPTLIDGLFMPMMPLATYLDSAFMRRAAAQSDLLMKYLFKVDAPRAKGLFSNEEARRQYSENAIETYRRHNAMVKRVVPKEKLLMFKLEDGWGPLCEFLGKPVPDVPFPKVNETKELQKRMKGYVKASYQNALIRMAKRWAPVAVVLAGVGIWWWRG